MNRATNRTADEAALRGGVWITIWNAVWNVINVSTQGRVEGPIRDMRNAVRFAVWATVGSRILDTLVSIQDTVGEVDRVEPEP